MFANAARVLTHRWNGETGKAARGDWGNALVRVLDAVGLFLALLNGARVVPTDMVGKAALAVTEVVVIGAGPAGGLAALRAADLGARTVLVSSAEFGGMAANDGPVPVRTLAHAARLLRAARKVGQYGIDVKFSGGPGGRRRSRLARR